MSCWQSTAEVSLCNMWVLVIWKCHLQSPLSLPRPLPDPPLIAIIKIIIINTTFNHNTTPGHARLTTEIVRYLSYTNIIPTRYQVSYYQWIKKRSKYMKWRRFKSKTINSWKVSWLLSIICNLDKVWRRLLITRGMCNFVVNISMICCTTEMFGLSDQKPSL